MALSNILNPPKRTQFIIRGSFAAIEAEAILGGLLPLPDFIGVSDSVILTIDATISQTHRISQRIPQHPVEEGFDITDDVQLDAKSLSLNCINSDIPGDLVAAIAEPIASLVRGASLSITTWQILKGLMGEAIEGTTLRSDAVGQPFDVITGLDLYENMLISNIVVTRSNNTGEALNYSVNLKEIRTVTSETISTGRGTGAPIGSAADVDSGVVAPATPSAGTASAASAVAGGLP